MTDGSLKRSRYLTFEPVPMLLKTAIKNYFFQRCEEQFVQMCLLCTYKKTESETVFQNGHNQYNYSETCIKRTPTGPKLVSA